MGAVRAVIGQQRQHEVVAEQAGAGHVEADGRPVGVVPALARTGEAGRGRGRIDVDGQQVKPRGQVVQRDDKGVGIADAVRILQHRGVGEGDQVVRIVVDLLADGGDAVVRGRIVDACRVIAGIDGPQLVVGPRVKAGIGDRDRAAAGIVVPRRRIGSAVPGAATGFPVGESAGFEIAVHETGGAGGGWQGQAERHGGQTPKNNLLHRYTPSRKNGHSPGAP